VRLVARGGFLLLAASACGSADPAPERHIVAHAIAGCPLQSGTATLQVTALGDFGSARAAGTLDARGTSDLDLPANLVGVEAQLLPRGAWGVGYADPPADISFALWSTEDACDASSGTISPSVGGQALTMFDGGRGLLLAGLLPAPSQPRSAAAFALALDLMTGEISPALSTAGLPRPRAFATATAFGDGALVAGGVDPNEPGDPGDDVVVDTAFVFSAGRFESAPIELGDPRAHHGAVTLVSGETLLVGGIGPSGAPLASLEAIDPATRTSRFFQLGTLQEAREDPVVLRLANDEIFVAGGTAANGAPVSSVEWFAEDGSGCSRASCLAHLGSVRDRAYVALAGGSVLAAGGSDAVAGMPISEVWWIRPDGTVEALPALSAEQRGSGKVRLVAGSDGEAWLFNGATWWMFDPWQGAFIAPEVAPSGGPETDVPAPLAVDLGLFLWLERVTPNDPESAMKLRGFRHDVRGPYARDADVMLLSSATHWVADRAPLAGADVVFDRAGLHLANGARAVLADTVYGDFDVRASMPNHSLPRMDVGTFTIGEGDCAWPVAGGAELEVTRQGTSLDVRVDGEHRSCSGPAGHVGIALRAPDTGSAVVTKFSIARL
jgi:hypothetical protein